MMEKTHNYLYKITNQLNGMFYYGIHSTDNLNDRYAGGGTMLKRAYKEYGRKNFIKEIIADYPTRKEVSDHEAKIVTLELIQLEECYNSKTGGDIYLSESSTLGAWFVCSEDAKIRIGNAHSKKCVIEGIVYASQLKASSTLGVGEKTVGDRIKSKKDKWKNWKRCEE